VRACAKEKRGGREKKMGRGPQTYFASSRQRLGRDKPVTPATRAQQGGARGTPHQPRSTIESTIADSVMLEHVARQSVIAKFIFLRLFLKY
jgi:hypothetical protein